ncbi:putative ribonucleotide transport ATP-binding protein mkl [Cupriavidus yeoncheonensis]|uniref:Ribonucleotide transport ATP-binding protein mkl n=1 Tax=Cupriavidus yeoncheonensis TaxID=1462994 RepID=A0A916MZA1_9BURK|nr:ATP-binding cassette domain-containing protein [Cupriavidus yeoncheonensis]CAG2150902.1 putative ribonucleotide transport ATP-binding protein mkl [Cupriavidus yeoncheonensis]
MADQAFPVRLTGIWTQFGDKVIHRDLDLDVGPGEVVALVGGSGSGKTTLLRHMMGLTEPARGTVEIFGEQIQSSRFLRQRHLRERWGVLFQFGALFSALSVLENIMVPLHERGGMTLGEMRDIAYLKLAQVGLNPTDADKRPSELSGGMVKRAALARAIVLDPELLFLDEPTSGLDPVAASEFVELILSMRHLLRLAAVVVTHEIFRLEPMIDRVAVLADQRLIANGPLEAVRQVDHPFIHQYFQTDRTSAT